MIYYKKKQSKNMAVIVNKRYVILTFVIVISMLVLTISLFYVQIINGKYYKTKAYEMTKNTTYGESTPRGRIYDRNHRLIVDNKAVKTITYKRAGGSLEEEITIAYLVGEMIDVDFKLLSVSKLKDFFLLNHQEIGEEKITDEEYRMLAERKLTNDDIYNMKIERITDEDLNEYTDVDREAAYIYYLMTNGYYYATKVIKKNNVTDEEYAKVSSNLSILKGFNTKLDWERIYPYGDVFRTMLGNVSTSETGIPYELKDYYLENGYQLNDRVGTSYIEYQYENYLKGSKNKYEISSYGENKLIEEGSRGNDIVLTIDIELQKAVEDIITNELISTKKEPNTEYYNRSFAIISNPNTGEILAMSGKQIITKGDGTYTIYDYTPGVFTTAVVPGSIVKGASHIVGYNTGALQIGEVREDRCIKIAATPIKCSWTTLGTLNDITALKQSSNVYQYLTAINVGKGNYRYGYPLSIDTKAFDIYRNIFAEFGLGIKTGIDLPIESTGYKGSSRESGLLLDMAIGQYDNYTPIQLAQYINTIATKGYRIKPHLLKSIYSGTGESLENLIYEEPVIILNKVNTKDEYMDRVRMGFEAVASYGGTGYNYINPIYDPACKTGTSESFVDSDNDGYVDTQTITNTFGGYAPSDNPQVSFVVISPDVGHYNNGNRYRTVVNKRLSYKVSQKYFEIYK